MGPTPLTIRRNRRTGSRKVMCEHYDECLDIAIAEGWEGFTCDECNGFKELDWSRQQWIRDRTNCMALIYAMMRLGYRDALQH
jgi:ssDNA-binding Zn-finger/Zn-ribbon topoisomerase 1